MTTPLYSFGKKYAASQWRFYLSGTLALIVTNIIVLEIPQLAKQVINALADQRSLDSLTLTALAVIGLGCAQVLIRTASRMLIFWPGRTLEAAVKEDVFVHILRSALGKLANFSTGDLTSRLNNDVTQLRIFFAFGVLQVLNVICISIFTVSKMASISASLTALSIAPMFLMLAITRAMMPRLYASMRQNTESLGRLTGKVSEAFSHVHTIQMMNAVDTLTDKMRPENDAIFESNIRTIKLRTLTWPLMIVLIGISQFATLAWGGKLVISGALTVGDIMAFNIYIGMLTFPFASLGIILNVYQRAKPASERLRAITDLPTERADATATAALTHTQPLLAVERLTFEWPDGRAGVRDISFEIRPGERVGVFGSIGSGKSTLFNLLTKLYEPSSGAVRLNGLDTRELSHDAVRRSVAYGLQQPLLFSESVKDNLLLGLDESQETLRQMEDACRRAMILPDIERMPQKWDTLIGEKGIKLSGGQKQRLSLARLLMRPANLIILDDVLSAVDHETEQNLIASLLNTKAALIIASHRPSILVPCDKILVMDKGRIIAQGTYGEVRHLIESRELRGGDA